MNYFIDEIYCVDSDCEWNIINIFGIDGCIFIKVESGSHTKLINVRDIYFGYTIASNMYENNVANYKYTINWMFSCSDPLDNYPDNPLRTTHPLILGHAQTNGDNVTFTPNGPTGTTSTNVHVYNVHFMIPNGSYCELYRYPLLDLVWHDIWMYYMMILQIDIICDIQKIIQRVYIMLVNNILQPSFKLF